MLIQVKVATILLKKAELPLESSKFVYDVPDGIDVDGLITLLGIPRGLVGSVTVNNRRARGERTIAEDDIVAIIPAISGG